MGLRSRADGARRLRIPQSLRPKAVELLRRSVSALSLPTASRPSSPVANANA